MDQLNQIITSSRSANKAERENAELQLKNIKLDGATTQLLMEFIGNQSVDENNRWMAATVLKNMIKKVFGSHSFTHYDDKSGAKPAQQQDQGEVLASEDPANLMDD